MKVTACVTTTINVDLDVENPAFEKLYATHSESPYKTADDSVYEEATQFIEEILNLPFGNDEVSTTIVGVYAKDRTPILEW